jgi:hypothetical protein
MGKLSRIALTAVLLLAACKSREESAAPSSERRPLERIALEPLVQPSDPRFDAQGALKPSGRRFSWLELPIGFSERAGSTERAGSFEAKDIPFAKVRDYLDARIAAEKLDFTSNGIYFRRAKPTHTKLALPPLHVTLLDVAGEARPVAGEARGPAGERSSATRSVRLLIDDLAPPSTPPPSVESARQLLARERQQLE